MRSQKITVFLVSWLFAAVAGCAEDKYVQTDCTVYANSVGVWLTRNGEEEDGVPYRVFEFSKKGVVIGVSPTHYAQDWSQIAEISHRKQSNLDTGLLSFKLLEKDGSHHIQNAGIITNECWASIGEFIEKNDIETRLVTEVSDD